MFIADRWIDIVITQSYTEKGANMCYNDIGIYESLLESSLRGRSKEDILLLIGQEESIKQDSENILQVNDDSIYYGGIKLIFKNEKFINFEH
jgi:hypothetical protein